MRNPKLREALKPGRHKASRVEHQRHAISLRRTDGKTAARFSCGNSRIVRGGRVTARDAAAATEWWKCCRGFATRR
jgi:hypothetical protein